MRRWIQRVPRARPLLWTFLPTPLVHDLIRDLDPELTVYYCVDDLPSSSPGARRLETSDMDLLRTADLVFVTSEKLRTRAARVRADVHVFPFGVDYETFERIRTEAGAPPGGLETVARPIVGYIGGLNQKMDQDLLVETARRRPDLNFVLVGPVETDVSSLLRQSNLRLLGPVPHTAVPRYIKEFAVGIVPYRLNEYTSHVYPSKLNEYLAMGIPVVSTDLPEIRRFNQVSGDLIRVAGNAEGFASALEAALTEGPAGSPRQRIQAARLNSSGPARRGDGQARGAGAPPRPRSAARSRAPPSRRPVTVRAGPPGPPRSSRSSCGGLTEQDDTPVSELEVCDGDIGSALTPRRPSPARPLASHWIDTLAGNGVGDASGRRSSPAGSPRDGASPLVLSEVVPSVR